MAQAQAWTPYNSLTKPPTNLKEAIDWVLRVTGRDGKKNEKTAPAAPPSTSNAPHCLCYLAKAIKDLLYDAKDPGSPGPSQQRYWDTLLLDQEKTLVLPVLTDLGLLGDSTSAARDTCAGGTEVIKALIDHLALGLQKWVGWKEGDTCCLKGTEGIGGQCKCTASSGGAGCCGTGGRGTTTCHECDKCGTSSSGGADQKCYLSAYCKPTAQPSGDSYWPTISGDSTKVHLLARIFLGSVCLIWSGLSQLGFLTCNAKGSERRWEESSLNNIENAENKGLASFMAAMGYDLDRIKNGTGYVVWKILAGKDKKNSIPWKEFASLGDKTGDSVAEYYSSIYENAKEALKKDNKTESICEQYPLLVLHILASGYFRAGSAGAKGITTLPAKPATSATSATPVSRKPRTIREILYWLSALPYSQGYRELVDRMQGKMESGTLNLEGDSYDKKTELKRDCITHYLMAACGYCPLVLIGIQGTIEKEVKADTQAPSAGPAGVAAAQSTNKCPEHKKNPRSGRCNLDDIKKKKEEAAKAQLQQQQQQQQQHQNNNELKEGQVCYRGYHLEVSKFGPLHGMYANGLFGFQMDMSSAQCLDQLRVYVYHCFYQLYFLRKQCKVGVAEDKKAVLGWKSCRYGSGVYMGSGYNKDNLWICKTEGAGGETHTKKCGLQNAAGSSTAGTQISPLMCFLCDGIGSMACGKTVGSGVDKYPPIEDHMNCPKGVLGHFGGPPKHCPVPMGWQAESTSTSSVNHFKGQQKYPAHCTGRTLSLLLEYYCDPDKCPSGTLVVLLRLLACITPTVPRTLGDLFGFYYHIVYIGGNSASGGEGVYARLKGKEEESKLYMMSIGGNDKVVEALTKWNDSGSGCTSGGSCAKESLKCLYGNEKQCTPFLSPLSGQQYGQLSPVMAGTYLSWLVYLIEKFEGGLEDLKKGFQQISCTSDGCQSQQGTGCDSSCTRGTHGNTCPAGSGSAGSAVGGKGGSGVASSGVCGCDSVVSCTGVLPVLYKYGFGYGNVTELHKTGGRLRRNSALGVLNGDVGSEKKCHEFLKTLEAVLKGNHLTTGIGASGLHHEINKLIYTTRLPWIFVLTIAWLVAVLYLAFGAIWPLDWTHMRSHCRGLFRKGSLSPWEILMVGKKKGRGILEYFGGR
eukprot:XP_001608667.1 variant erythrocyte surface antigen-1, beta subunit [Babesia bovis T2Bo]